MRSSKWAPGPGGHDPFAKLQAAFRTTHTSSSTRQQSSAQLSYNAEEFVPQRSSLPSKQEDLVPKSFERLSLVASRPSQEAAPSTSADLTPAITTTLPADNNPTSTSVDATGGHPGAQALKHADSTQVAPMATPDPSRSGTKLALKVEGASPKADQVATSIPIMPTAVENPQDGDADAMAREIAEWEAEEERKAALAIAERKRAFIAERQAKQAQAEQAARTRVLEEKARKSREEALAAQWTKATTALQSPKRVAAKSDENQHPLMTNTAVAGTAGVTSHKLAPSLLAPKQNEQFALIAPGPISSTFKPSTSGEKSQNVTLRPSLVKANVQAPPPATGGTVKVSGCPTNDPNERLATDDRAYYDKQRLARRLKDATTTAAASVPPLTSFNMGKPEPQAREHDNSAMPPHSRTSEFKFEFKPSQGDVAYGSALGKLHARPAIVTSGTDTIRPPSVEIPERRASITPPQQSLVADLTESRSGADGAIAGRNPKPDTAVTARPREAKPDKEQRAEAKQSMGAHRNDDASPTPNDLPVDKLAFTLRSSSREKETPTVKMETPHQDPLATAHAAMNEIDRANVKTQNEFVFKAWPKPVERPPTFVRRVNISGIPLDFTASQVLSLVWGGRVERVEYKAKSGHATVLFMTHADCEKYYNATCNGVDIPGNTDRFAIVKLADRAEAAHEFLRGLIAIDATRCIRAVGVDTAFGMSALTKLAMSGKREVERIVNGTTPRGARAVEFRFLNVYDAMRFKSELEKLEDWEQCNIFCAPDPCAKATGVHLGVSV